MPTLFGPRAAALATLAAVALLTTPARAQEPVPSATAVPAETAQPLATASTEVPQATPLPAETSQPLETASAEAVPQEAAPQAVGPLPSDDDFATQALAAPWDMSGPSSLAFSQTRDRGNLANLRFENGLLVGTSTTNDPRVSLLLPSNPSVNPVPGEGGFVPINADRYRYLTVRLYVAGAAGAGDFVQVFWQRNAGQPAYGYTLPSTTGNGRMFRDGWNTLTIDLRAEANAVPWQGQIQGLYLDPSVRQGLEIRIDFVRLSANAPATAINLNASGDLYIRRAGSNDEYERVLRGFNRSYSWPVSLAAGSYELVAGATRDLLTVNATPQLRITAPSYASGPGFAWEVRHNPWDMNDAGDVDAASGLRSLSFGGGLLTGVNSNNDPQIVLHQRPSQPIDTQRYHYLTLRMRVEGQIDTNLGSGGRLLWGSPPQVSASQNWVVYEGWQTVSFDLNRIKLEAGGLPWSQSRPWYFRIDPHEFAAPRLFQIDNVRLSGDERANQSFTITYSVADADGPGLAVQFFYTTSQGAGSGGSAISCASSGGACVWDTSRVPAGTYYIYARSSDGVNTRISTSKTGVIVSH